MKQTGPDCDPMHFQEVTTTTEPRPPEDVLMFFLISQYPPNWMNIELVPSFHVFSPLG